MSAQSSIYQLRVESPGIRTSAGLDGITALPDHGADGAAVHVYNSRLVNAYAHDRISKRS